MSNNRLTVLCSEGYGLILIALMVLMTFVAALRPPSQKSTRIIDLSCLKRANPALEDIFNQILPDFNPPKPESKNKRMMTPILSLVMN